jgi:two-component system cell cycle response regulator
LDLGADDAMPGGFGAEELALRLTAQLRRKAVSDRLRNTVHDDVRAAVRDPLTGLYNRRFALPHLSRTIKRASHSGQGFAVMLADLDHFKAINDRYGHPAGDAVLIETARRLQAGVSPGDLVARVGGEEFMIVLAETDPAAATSTAERLRHRINQAPFRLPGIEQPIAVTTSLGVVTVSDSFQSGMHHAPVLDTDALVDAADKALYASKGAGRDQVTIVQPAA